MNIYITRANLEIHIILNWCGEKNYLNRNWMKGWGT